MLPLIKDDVQEIVLFFIGTERPTTYTLPYTTLFRTRAHSPGCEVGGELQPLAIVFSPRRCRELSRFRRHGMQSERASLAKHDANQAGSQQHAQAASDGLDDRLRVSHRMQRLRHFHQALRAAMLLTRDARQTTGF